MKISFKNNNRVIVYTKGATKEEIINQLEKRIKKYDACKLLNRNMQKL